MNEKVCCSSNEWQSKSAILFGLGYVRIMNDGNSPTLDKLEVKNGFKWKVGSLLTSLSFSVRVRLDL